ncbi:release factor glutamine methyltransferase [Marchantia polymorpha subsp. ruderalis]|uniref:Methyltransferase small domain-containing protein n=2 Tax=Marchantia polymorpha TaxID=3197 RepID=A0A176WNH0_MARPO|nr:hypothetical protein AXG93_167s1300 [Marchantia polymorpha subsp. ruderalis]PTQ38439.1 hypothetical protein MARPO_0051s0043 [Marchantia polymorpha]BBN17813.1 hypothetical protein Mp_7g17050 [Marchantia polymorpha subsp. ruderalis]|eukprot:PTQ38439.1 hypothetical protein MARPO_0051s0043 [Marchantia polymorpha]
MVMAALARAAVPVFRFPTYLCNRRICGQLKAPGLSPSSWRLISRARKSNSAQSELRMRAHGCVSSSHALPSSLGYTKQGQFNRAGVCSCSSTNKLAGLEYEVSVDSSSSYAVGAGQEKRTADFAISRFGVAIPVSERPPSSVASLTDVLQWRKQAQDLASSVGSEFVDADGGPEVSDLLRELEWLLDDSVGGCACWTENLDLQTGSWKICSWRDVKDGVTSKLESDTLNVYGKRKDLTASGGDISASFSAFADLSKERYGDPVTEFATDCGCSCDGIRENLEEMASFEELESRSRTLPTLTLNKLTDVENSPDSSSKEKHSLQLMLKMSLHDMDRAWKERILERRPFQYVVAAAHWRDLVLSVMEGVLIPRPETEQLVDMAEVAIMRDKSLAKGVWADLGTGSGAIAIGVARLLQSPGHMLAIDASTAAVAVAKRNVERYSLQDKVNVLQGFWFSPLQDKVGELAGVISNPPYIPTENVKTLQAEVGKHEPKIALDGGPDGADDLREICNGSAIALRSGGFLALETNGGQQAEVVRDYLCKIRVLEGPGNPVLCFHEVKCVKDFAGITRFVTAIRR